jgi:cyclopropane fatty-acyl-phospholipid synthase-like methyltransferase
LSSGMFTYSANNPETSMKNILWGFLNPVRHFRAMRYKRKARQERLAGNEPELDLYARILRNDMLHWGFFDDPDIAPDTISIKDFEDAQLRYAEKITEQLGPAPEHILDVGCGMGGLAGMLSAKGYSLELLSPNARQKKHIERKYPELPFHLCKYEDFLTERTFGTIINSESFQYIRLDQAFEVSKRVLATGGRWIIVDYFRLGQGGRNKSGHLIEDFRRMVKESGWKIRHEEDITLNVLPTIRMASLYAERFFIPLLDFGFEKFRVKRPWLYYMLSGIREKAMAKTDKEMAAIDPERFLKEKKYMFFILER